MFYTKEISTQDLEDVIEETENSVGLTPVSHILEDTFVRFAAITKLRLSAINDRMGVASVLSVIAPLKRNPQFSLRFVTSQVGQEVGAQYSKHIQSMLGIYELPFDNVLDENSAIFRAKLLSGEWAYQYIGADVVYLDPIMDQGRLTSHLSEGGYFRLDPFIDEDDERPDPQPVSEKFAVLTDKVDKYVLDRIGIYMPEENTQQTAFEQQQRILLES